MKCPLIIAYVNQCGHDSNNSIECPINYVQIPIIYIPIQLICKSCSEQGHGNKKSRHCKFNKQAVVARGVPCRFCNQLGHFSENSQRCSNYVVHSTSCKSCHQAGHIRSTRKKCLLYEHIDNINCIV